MLVSESQPAPDNLRYYGILPKSRGLQLRLKGYAVWRIKLCYLVAFLLTIPRFHAWNLPLFFFSLPVWECISSKLRIPFFYEYSVCVSTGGRHFSFRQGSKHWKISSYFE